MNRTKTCGDRVGRVTDEEITDLKAGGIHMSNLANIRRRLDSMVKVQLLSQQAADDLYADSPFHEQPIRAGQFWMVSHPFHPSNGHVALLLEHWGGEGVYFWQQDEALLGRVKQIGLPRVIEIAVPLRATKQVYAAAKAVAGTYALSNGFKADWPAFDICAVAPLGPDVVLDILSEGDSKFFALGRGYPARYFEREV